MTSEVEYAKVVKPDGRVEESRDFALPPYEWQWEKACTSKQEFAAKYDAKTQLPGKEILEVKAEAIAQKSTFKIAQIYVKVKL